MQQRFHVSYHSDYLSAVEAKKEIQKKQPNSTFQIRKRKNNFDLVGRIKLNDATRTVVESYKKKKKSWKKVPSLPNLNP